MIASPGDVLPERDLIRDLLHEWNFIHSVSTKTILEPVGWETHSAPDLSGPAQELINERVLKDCDLLVGLFWTRVGTPTGKSVSGSVEEIQRHLDAGKPAMVYFSLAPVAPESLDAEQFKALLKFKDWCRSKGLIEEYENLSDLRSKFARQLPLMLRDNKYIRDLTASNAPAVVDTPSQIASIAKPQLSDEAKTLLIEASLDRNGYVLKTRTMSGTLVQTNGKSLIEDRANPRQVARWEFAIDQLLRMGLLKDVGVKGEVFSLTAEGFELADRLRVNG
jgi:hypothetical protein